MFSNVNCYTKVKKEMLSTAGTLKNYIPSRRQILTRNVVVGVVGVYAIHSLLQSEAAV